MRDVAEALEPFGASALLFVSFLSYAVFLGFDDPRTLGAHDTGGGTAAPIFKSFVQKGGAVSAFRPAEDAVSFKTSLAKTSKTFLNTVCA